MTRFRRSALGALAVIGALASSAWAQDGDSAAAAWRFESRALDYSTMLQAQHGSAGGPAEIPLPRASVRVLVRQPGRDSATLESTTDLVGRFVLEGPQPAPGSTLEFFITSEKGENARPGYYGKPWPVDDGTPPEFVEFYEVATSPPDGLVLANVINVVSTVEREAGNPDSRIVQVRHTAMLVNQDARVWLGDLSRNDFSTFGIRIPEGFELRNVTVNNQPVDATDIGRSGHDTTEKWLYRSPIFPAMQRGLMFQAMFVAPYEEGREYDLSWHNEYAVQQYSLNIEEGLFSYLPPNDAKDGVQLTDGGTNPPMGNIQIITHSYGLQRIPPHQTLSARFVAGAPFPWKALIWTGSILLVVVGAGLLGFVASRPRQSRDAEVAAAKRRVKVPASPAGREHELEMLDRRLRRGEITSIEHDVRKAAIERAQQATAPAQAPAARAPAAGIAAEVAEIEARVQSASVGQLRDDVRTLAKAVHRLLGDR